jgi:hypothetical protein
MWKGKREIIIVETFQSNARCVVGMRGNEESDERLHKKHKFKNVIVIN